MPATSDKSTVKQIGWHPVVLSCHYISHNMARHALQDNWEHLPHDLLVAVVKHLQPQDAKGMHRVCRSWHLAVRCGLQSMKPTPKLTPFYDVRDYFPRVSLCTRDTHKDLSTLLPNVQKPHASCALLSHIMYALQPSGMLPDVCLPGANAASALAGSAAAC